jgi:hypothetical protein
MICSAMIKFHILPVAFFGTICCICIFFVLKLYITLVIYFIGYLIGYVINCYDISKAQGNYSGGFVILWASLLALMIGIFLDILFKFSKKTK